MVSIGMCCQIAPPTTNPGEISLVLTHTGVHDANALMRVVPGPQAHEAVQITVSWTECLNYVGHARLVGLTLLVRGQVRCNAPMCLCSDGVHPPMPPPGSRTQEMIARRCRVNLSPSLVLVLV